MNKKYTIAMLLIATISMSSCSFDLWGGKKQTEKNDNTIVEVDKGAKTIEGNWELTEAQKKEKAKQEFEKKKVEIKKHLEEKVSKMKEIKSLWEIGDVMMNKHLLSPENQKKVDKLIVEYTDKKAKSVIGTLKKTTLDKKDKQKVLEIVNNIRKDNKMSPTEKSFRLEGLEKSIIELNKRMIDYKKNPKKVNAEVQKSIAKTIKNQSNIQPIKQMTGDLFNFVFEDNFKKVQNEINPSCIKEVKTTKEGIRKQIQTNLAEVQKRAKDNKANILYLSAKDLEILHNGLQSGKIKVNSYFNKIVDYDAENKEPMVFGGVRPYIVYKGKKIDPILVDYAYQVKSINDKYKLGIKGLDKVFFIEADKGIYGEAPYSYMLRDINQLIAMKDEKLFCKIIENVYVKDKDYKKNIERFMMGDIEMDNIKGLPNLQNVLQGLNATF